MTLSDIDMDSIKSPVKHLESCWYGDNKGSCKIEPVYYNRGLAEYLSNKKNMDLSNHRRDSWDIDYYRRNLLDKLRGPEVNVC